jgi:hypothetical protein
MAKANGKSERAVIITTEHRGVFFGYATDTDGETIQLKRARLCVYWPQTNRGFMGLAAQGPLDGARVGPPATITLRKITAVMEVENPEAIARWEASPWR